MLGLKKALNEHDYSHLENKLTDLQRKRGDLEAQIQRARQLQQSSHNPYQYLEQIEDPTQTSAQHTAHVQAFVRAKQQAQVFKQCVDNSNPAWPNFGPSENARLAIAHLRSFDMTQMDFLGGLAKSTRPLVSVSPDHGEPYLARFPAASQANSQVPTLGPSSNVKAGNEELFGFQSSARIEARSGFQSATPSWSQSDGSPQGRPTEHQGRWPNESVPADPPQESRIGVRLSPGVRGQDQARYHSPKNRSVSSHRQQPGQVEVASNIISLQPGSCSMNTTS